MKLFDCTLSRAAWKEVEAHSLAGGQALLLHRWGMNSGPTCFRGQDVIGKIMDQDVSRLIATARGFGVRRVVVDRRGQPWQHVDLCRGPLRRAIEACTEA